MRKQGAREIGRSGRGGRGRGKWTVSTLHLPVHVEVGGLLVLAAGAPDVTCLPRLNVPLQAGGLHVSEQELDTDMEHAKKQDTCLGRGRGARMCVHAAREVPLARSQHGLGQLLTPFLPSGSQTVIRDRFLFQFAERV